MCLLMVTREHAEGVRRRGQGVRRAEAVRGGRRGTNSPGSARGEGSTDMHAAGRMKEANAKRGEKKARVTRAPAEHAARARLPKRRCAGPSRRCTNLPFTAVLAREGGEAGQSAWPDLKNLRERRGSFCTRRTGGDGRPRAGCARAARCCRLSVGPALSLFCLAWAARRHAESSMAARRRERCTAY